MREKLWRSWLSSPSYMWGTHSWPHCLCLSLEHMLPSDRFSPQGHFSNCGLAQLDGAWAPFFFFNATEENRVENIRGCGLEEREVWSWKLLCVRLCHISRLTGLLWKSHSHTVTAVWLWSMQTSAWCWKLPERRMWRAAAGPLLHGQCPHARAWGLPSCLCLALTAGSPQGLVVRLRWGRGY